MARRRGVPMKCVFSLAVLVAACSPVVRGGPPVHFVPPVAAEVEAKGRSTTMDQFLVVGEQAGVVCLGEQHDASEHHRLHARLVKAWGTAWTTAGARVAVGYEMFEASMQPTLTGFSRGDFDYPGLIERSDWQRRWGHDPVAYRPIFESARTLGAEMLALNAERALVRRVAREGLTSLRDEERATLPELVLDDPGHRKFFDAAMGHAAHGGSPDRLYAAQVLWDESMAARAADWLLSSRTPPRRLVIVAGNGHCHESAIPARIQRRFERAGRSDLEVVSVLTRTRGGTLPSFATSDYILTVDEEQMAKQKKAADPAIEQFGDGIIARNRRAAFDYELGDTYEAGLQLVGSEVKILRAGKADLSEAYVTVEREEAFLHGANIPELPGTPYGHLPKRKRKLLLHRTEIDALTRATEREGMTIVATKIYFRRGRAKVEIAVARGKKQFDKRESVKRKEADREARAAIGGRRR